MAGLGYPYGVIISEPRPPLSVEIIAALKAAGMTGADIARAYSVSRQAVSKVWRRDGTPTPRQVAHALAWPWKVPERQQRQRVYAYLSEHLAYVAETMLPESNLPVSRLTMSKLPAGNIGPTDPTDPADQPNPTGQPTTLSWTQLKNLKAFYLRMRDYVIVFDPEMSPSPGCSAGGFAYVFRNPEDEDLLIRVSDGISLTDEAKNLWRMPAELPNPVARR